MTNQEDLKLFRFNNTKPNSFHKEKYQYQLFHNAIRMFAIYSDNEYFKGKVTVNGQFKLDLIASASEITDLESDNVFVIDVEIIK